MKRKDPAPLQELIKPIFQERGHAAHLTITAVRSRWAEIVGSELARKTWPLRMQRGVLWIGAPDASWAYQFHFLRTELLQRVASVLGPSDIHELRFKESELPTPDTEAPPAALEAEPEPATVDADLAQAAERISDPNLRSLFLRSLTRQRRQREQGHPPPGTP